MIDKINNYNINIDEVKKQKYRLDYENQQSREWGINIYNANRKHQKLKSEIREYDLLKHLASKEHIVEIKYINEYRQGQNTIDEYLENEWNKRGVDIVITTKVNTEYKYYKCDMKCLGYTKYMGTNPTTIVDTIPIQIINYNGADGWGISDYKISDFIIVYIENKCILKIDAKKLKRYMKVNKQNYNWIKCKKGTDSKTGEELAEYIVNVKVSDILGFTIVEDIRNINI